VLHWWTLGEGDERKEKIQLTLPLHQWLSLMLNMGLFHSFGFVCSLMPVLVASTLMGSVICDEGTIVCLNLIVISLREKIIIM
jgi:hypothetical protein